MLHIAQEHNKLTLMLDEQTGRTADIDWNLKQQLWWPLYTEYINALYNQSVILPSINPSIFLFFVLPTDQF